MNCRNTIIATFATLLASLGLAEDFKTIDGREYKDATVARVEPDGVVVKTKTGIAKLYFIELSNEIRQRFNYNRQQAAAFSAAEAANYAATQNPFEEAQRRQVAAGQNVRNVGETQATVSAIHALQGRLAQIQSEEALLQQQIHQMETWHLGRLERADLENLRRQLAALRSEEGEVRSHLHQLQQAQR